MNTPTPADALSPALRLVLLTAGIVVTVAGLRMAAPLLVPLALALFITVVSLPLLLRLVARGVPVAIAAAVVLVVDVTVLLGIVWLLVQSVAEMAVALPGYLQQMLALEASVLEWLAVRGIRIEASPYLDTVPAERLLGLVTTFLRGATDALSTAFLVALITVFVLLESTVFPRKLRQALGGRAEGLAWLATVLTEVQRYLALKTLLSAATGLLVGLAAWALGVEFALLWGLLAFFLNFIPNVGSLLAAVPAVLIAFLQLGAAPALALAAAYLVVNTVVGSLIEPALLGRRLGLSPLVVVLSLVFWGWVWGAVGMFLSVPLLMVMKIVLEHTHGYRWIAVLMSGRPAPLEAAVGVVPEGAGDRLRRG